MVRGARSTLLLLLVLAGLGAYIYFVDRERPLDDAEPREQAFGEVDSEAIEEIEIRSEDGETTRVRKTDGQWRLVEPISADADADELSTIASTLAGLEVQRVVEEEPADLIRFGLDPARIDVGFRTADDTEMRRVLIGNRTPTGSDIYARTPDSRRVFLVASYIDTTFNRNTFALRDKDILKVERGTAETMEMTRGSTVLAFTKSAGDWNIVEPIEARGDFGVIESAVERLASGQMQGIVTEKADDLRQFGLDRPTATFVVGSGSARATLVLGRTENALVYAKDAARPMVFTVAPTLETDLFKTLEDFRRKDLFDSRAFTATHVEIVQGGTTLAFEKTKKDDAEVWQRAGGGDVDATAIDDALGRVTGLRASGFESGTPAALRSPVLRVTIQFGEGRMETVTFGRSGGDVLASRTDEPGAATVDAMAFDEAIAALDALKKT